jgi:hypothetical protein|tara:strand:- start:11 stop:229 length:219 start_codon:yes stop_codon:yes gene_type:complete
MKKRQARKVLDKNEFLGIEYRHTTFEAACKRMGMTQKHRVYVNAIPSGRWWFTPPGYDAFGRKIKDDTETNQ